MVDSHLHASSTYRITILLPLSFAYLASGGATIRIFFGVPPRLDTSETPSFEFFSGSLRSLFDQLLDIDFGTVAVLTVRAGPNVPIPISLKS